MAKQLQILDPDFKLPDSYEDLVKVYRKAAKAADQRMVRLERLSEEENFKTADKYAYAKAQRIIKEWSGGDATRFNVKPPASTSALKEKIQDIKDFLGSATSTKQGIKNVHMKRADSLNKKYGTNYTWEQWDTFLNSELIKKLDEKLGGSPKTGASTREEAIGTLVKNKDKVIEAVEKSNAAELHVEDRMVGSVVRDLIAKNGDAVLEAFGMSPDTSNVSNAKGRKSRRKYRSKG